MCLGMQLKQYYGYIGNVVVLEVWDMGSSKCTRGITMGLYKWIGSSRKVPLECSGSSSEGPKKSSESYNMFFFTNMVELVLWVLKNEIGAIVWVHRNKMGVVV